MIHKPYILAADDDEIFREILKDQLSNYEVKTVSDGKSCLRDIKTRKPDLLLLDIHMPGINGFDVVLELHEDSKYRDLPIIFFTVTQKEQLEELPLDLKANDFIIKPYEESELINKINKILS